MTSRERILATLRRRPIDRLAMCETGFWPETLERWRGEGYPADADPIDYFGLDRMAFANDLFEPSFGLPEQTLEQTDEYRVYRDGYGKTIKAWLHSSHTPSILEPALTTWDGWQRLKPALMPSGEKFNNAEAERLYRDGRAGGHFLSLTPAEPMWFAIQSVMGYEQGLLAIAEQPDLIADMVTTYSDYLLGMMNLCWERGYHFDALWFWSDLCYRGGMLFSPTAARRLVLDHWKRLGKWAHDHDMPFIFHCDGNVGRFIPLLIEAGCDAVHPLEARAGNDVREYKRQFGDRICLIGNINADVVASGDRAAIEREVVEKIPVAANGGGYIYHIDHSVPPTVALDSYRFLLECVRKCG